MPTARDLIKGSLRLIGVLAAGEEPDASEADDALTTFNQMLGAWSLDQLFVYDATEVSHPLVPGTASYTVGPTGTMVTTARPMRLNSAYVRQGTLDFPLTPITAEQYGQIALKSTGNPWPQSIRFDASFPNATIWLYETPSAANTLSATYDMPLTTVASLNTSVSLPPGYDEAIKYGLAVRLAPEYGRPLDPGVVGGAQAALANVKRNNVQPLLLSLDGRLPRGGGRTSASFVLRGD